MTEGIGPTRQAVDELWRTHGLDRAAASVAIDATITARTLGYSESLANGETMLASREAASREPTAAAAKPELHQLPLISLAVSENAAVEPVVIASASADLEAREVLGEGGMGRVLLARQRSLAREVAVKVIKPEARTAPVIDALVTEAVLTGALEHPNIIPVHALGRDAEGQPLLVMKRIEGVSWRAVLRDPEHPAWQRLMPMVLADDLALVSAVTALGAVTVQRWFYAVSAVFAASSALTYLWPERAHIVFSIGPIGAVLVAAMMQKRGVGTSEPGHRER